MENQNLCQAFKDSCCFRLNEAVRMIEIALSKVKPSQGWERPNNHTLSLANQLLHLNGNMTQYILATLGDQFDERLRDEEFTLQEGESVMILWTSLKITVEEAKQCIETCTEGDFTRVYEVQGFELAGADVALHAVEHFSYHTGQIAFWVKQLTNAPLGFYEGFDLNLKI